MLVPICQSQPLRGRDQTRSHNTLSQKKTANILVQECIPSTHTHVRLLPVIEFGSMGLVLVLDRQFWEDYSKKGGI